MLMADIFMAGTKGWATFLAKHAECQSLLQEKFLGGLTLCTHATGSTCKSMVMFTLQCKEFGK